MAPAARSREASVLRHSALKYGAPSSDNLRAFRHFVVCYDYRLRNPRWVLEHVSRERSSGDAQRYGPLGCAGANWARRAGSASAPGPPRAGRSSSSTRTPASSRAFAAGCPTFAPRALTAATWCAWRAAPPARAPERWPTAGAAPQAPAANYKASQDAMTDTFVLSNISPQVGKGFNRCGPRVHGAPAPGAWPRAGP